MTAPSTAARFAVEVPPEMLQAMTGGGSIAPRISRDEALQVPAVLRARNLICGSLGTLPIRVHGPDRRVVTDVTYLVPQPDPDIPSSVVMAQTVEDLLFEGIAWWRVTKFGWHGFPVEARHVPVGSVHVAQTGSLLPSQMRISPDQPFPADGQVYIDGIPVRDDEVIRFDSPNPPLLRHAARAIRTCLLLDTTAALYAKSPLPMGWFEPQEGADPIPDEEIQDILDDWESARAKRATGYVNAALKYQMGQWSPEQLQLADARQHAVLEISRATGLDAEELGVSTTSRTYANEEQRDQAKLKYTFGAYVSAIQDRLSMRDVLPRGYVARIDFAGFLRSDTKTRMDTYQTGREVGAYDNERIAELEDIPLSTVQNAMRQNKPAPAPTPVEPAQPAASEEPPQMAARFDAADTDGTRITFDDPELAATFRVNPEKRTISGLAVPWGKIARAMGQKWRFSDRSSLHWSDDIGRVKLNLDHEHRQTIGRAVRLQPVSSGLDVSFQVARGPEGDRALALAEDGVYDGLSIEIDFADGDGYQPDPTDQSVNLVHRATLRHVALTPMPSFDDARVTRVAASRDDRSTTMAAPTATAAAEPSPQFDINEHLAKFAEQTTQAHKALTEQLGESIGGAISAGFKTALESLPAPQDGPQTVRAARFQVTYEPPVYAFSGMGHSLVRDAYHAYHQRDRDAEARLRKYQEQTEEMAKLAVAQLGQIRFAPQTTSTASQIIPPGYRPDLYVSELLRGRPLVNACSRGSIDNASPFTVPVFSSSTGVTADHVEGTNPADGSVAFATKTVTPGGISGRLVLTREIVDSSNPAIDQIALATMRESYARQTEAKVYTLLNGANGAGGVITGDNVPSGAQASTVAAAVSAAGGQALAKHIRERLAKYPFQRFAAPGVGLMGQNATTRLATAEGNDGRPLFPSVGAQNSAGIGNAITQGWFVDGLPFIPAWAMTGTAAGDSQIFMLNEADAWVWESPLLSFRYEEKQGPANIELNVFGYFAAHVLRPVGLSGIRITLV